MKLNPMHNRLGRKHAAHLLRRCTFGPSFADLTRFAELNPAAAFKQLKARKNIQGPPVDWKNGKTWVNPKPVSSNTHNRNLTTQVKTWWMENILQPEANLTDKMAFFWHTNFVSRQQKVDDATALYYQLRLFYHFALGNAKTLAREICYDNAMLIFLDNDVNMRSHLNENLGRELLELFTIGKGPIRGAGDYTHYTEHDVKQVARVLSGITTDLSYTNKNSYGLATGKVKADGRGLAEEHDAGVKQFSKAFQNQQIKPAKQTAGLATIASVHQEVDEMIDMIFRQKATAVNLCTKLYRYFVNSQGDPDGEVIGQMSDLLYKNNYEVSPVLEALFTSGFFYDQQVPDKRQIRGAKIKSPLELTAGLFRTFEIDFYRSKSNLKTWYESIFEYGILEVMRHQGMDLYEPASTAGYPAYFQMPGLDTNWITPDTLLKRYRTGERITRGKTFSNLDLPFRLEPAKFILSNSGFTDPGDPVKLVNDFLELMLPVEVEEARSRYFLNEVLLEGLEKHSWKMEWDLFRKQGKNPGLEKQLVKLVQSIIESPEFQLT